uniref:Uncharacterized protein n=1 Tax=Arundo donax TaxID=35708 RepID=A0A0A9G2H5_ARUDO
MHACIDPCMDALGTAPQATAEV